MNTPRQIYNPNLGKVEDWLKKYPPSKTKFENWSWIQIFSPKSKPSKEDVNGAVQEWKKCLSTLEKSKINPKLINDIAKKHNVLTGKWMLFLNSDEVDKCWELVVNGISKDKLSASSAKVAPSGHPYGCHLMCIYTSDFSNESDVMKVRQELKDLGFKSELDYKADMYTYIGINHQKNQWDISEVMFSK